MRTSRIVIFATAIAIAVSLFGAALYFPMNTNDAAQAPDASVLPVSATLDPIVVVANK
jgi:flagellar basal body-associated protein FliL